GTGLRCSPDTAPPRKGPSVFQTKEIRQRTRRLVSQVTHSALIFHLMSGSSLPASAAFELRLQIQAVRLDSPEKPIYVPFLIVGSIFIAFIIVGSLVAVYCCTCLRPKQPSQPIRFSLRSYQTETLPMILASTSFRTPSRQSSTATSSSSTGGSVRRFSFPRAEPGCLVASPPPPYTSGCFQAAHAVHLTQPSGFLVSPPYFGYPLQPEPALAGKSCSDFSQS
ncbi:PREDICTED: protein shisa-3 homolog, partial [Cariama cristata]|uniref:protein shisa-3 homolog n=1 Tax=Cariama cristata TaxID=54380 RepID=UPI0005208860